MIMTMPHSETVETLAVERYLLGEMSAPELETFEEHLFLCSECAEAVKTGAAFADNARAIIKEPPPDSSPERVRGNKKKSAWWKEYSFPMIVPAFAAAALLCLVCYQQFVIIPGLKAELAQEEMPQMLPTFVLHAISRGDQQVVAIPPNARYVSLYFDVVVNNPAGYIYEIRNTSGSIRFTGYVPQPTIGETLNLLIGRSQFPAGNYTLTMSTASPDARSIGQYPFQVVY
jgi:hypothetical protein